MHYIETFEKNHGVKITNYTLEDLQKDPDFPHINKSVGAMKWTKDDQALVRNKLLEAGF